MLNNRMILGMYRPAGAQHSKKYRKSHYTREID